MMYLGYQAYLTHSGKRGAMVLYSGRKPICSFPAQLCNYKAPTLVQAHCYVRSNGKVDFVRKESLT